MKRKGTKPKQSAEIKLPDTLEVMNASEVRDLLVKALAERPELTLDLGGITKCDTSGAQLLLAFHRSAASGNGRLINASDAVRRACADAGINLQEIGL